jgi:hypothetical protein
MMQFIQWLEASSSGWRPRASRSSMEHVLWRAKKGKLGKRKRNAPTRSRTTDFGITSAALYQLSYRSDCSLRHHRELGYLNTPKERGSAKARQSSPHGTRLSTPREDGVARARSPRASPSPGAVCIPPSARRGTGPTLGRRVSHARKLHPGAMVQAFRANRHETRHGCPGG